MWAPSTLLLAALSSHAPLNRAAPRLSKGECSALIHKPPGSEWVSPDSEPSPPHHGRHQHHWRRGEGRRRRRVLRLRPGLSKNDSRYAEEDSVVIGDSARLPRCRQHRLTSSRPGFPAARAWAVATAAGPQSAWPGGLPASHVRFTCEPELSQRMLPSAPPARRRETVVDTAGTK